MEKYKTLKIKESLSKPSQYISTCKELTLYLRFGYSKFPKNLQYSIFQDTLFAFNLLPTMEMHQAISAANSLLQSAEFVLPKQRRALAVGEHKHAVVASKRKSKTCQNDHQGLAPLPQDILVHVFSLLDLQSLISASAVCRSWNAAASDNHVWKSLYADFFCKSDNITKHKGNRRTRKTDDRIYSLEDLDGGVGIDWRSAFKTLSEDINYRKFKSYRGYCMGCRSIVWLINNRCSNNPNPKDGISHRIVPVFRHQILDYILYGSLSLESSSDSDSDTEDTPVFKLWAYPRQSS